MGAAQLSNVPAGQPKWFGWDEITAAAPQMTATMWRYLDQAATFLAPASVVSAEGALRQLAWFLINNTDVRTVAGISRSDIEELKLWLAARRGAIGGTLSANTQRQRLRTLRMFFERIIEWDWDDAPPRNPIISRDIPPRPEPLPKFLDDRDAAKLMTAARSATDPRDRLVLEVLARTGLRAGELCDLEADAVVQIGDAFWLRVPLGKLRNDRYVPLHPQLVELLAEWTATHLETIRRHHRLVADHRGTLDRHMVGRIVRRIGRSCGVKVHPHQLRPTSSATPSPPKPSTAGCASKPSPPCSGTAPWK